MLKRLVKLSALLLGMSCAMAGASPSTQLASLNERMNQLLSAIYTSPLLSKSATPSDDDDGDVSSTPETSYVMTSGPPQVVYMTPPMLESGKQPNELYPDVKHHVVRSAYPYPYEYVYPQYSAYPNSYPRYPEAPRSYPQISAAPVSHLPAYPSPAPYNQLSYPSPLPTPAGPYPPSFPSVANSLSYSPYPQPALSYSPSPFLPQPCSSPAPYLIGYSSLPSPNYPSLPSPNYPSLPSPNYPTLPAASYPSSYPFGYSSLPSQSYPASPAPSYSSPYPSLPALYSTPILTSPLPPAFLPGSQSPVSGIYASPVFNTPGYPSPYYPPHFPPAPLPKYSEVLHHHFGA